MLGAVVLVPASNPTVGGTAFGGAATDSVDGWSAPSPWPLRWTPPAVDRRSASSGSRRPAQLGVGAVPPVGVSWSAATIDSAGMSTGVREVSAPVGVVDHHRRLRRRDQHCDPVSGDADDPGGRRTGVDVGPWRRV